jgi:hypothetical protein
MAIYFCKRINNFYYLKFISLYFEEGKNFYKNYLKVGVSGLIGGLVLVLQ